VEANKTINGSLTIFFNETTKTTIRTVTYNELSELSVDWVWVWLTNCCAGLVGYFFMRSSAKILTQV
jgi:hypothetical protein